jgi:predicted DNA-binding protein
LRELTRPASRLCRIASEGIEVAEQRRGFRCTNRYDLVSGFFQSRQTSFKKGVESRERLHPTTPTTSRLRMSTERELAYKFKEAIEARNVEDLSPYLADDMTFEVLPSTLVVVLMGGTS